MPARASTRAVTLVAAMLMVLLASSCGSSEACGRQRKRRRTAGARRRRQRELASNHGVDEPVPQRLRPFLRRVRPADWSRRASWSQLSDARLAESRRHLSVAQELGCGLMDSVLEGQEIVRLCVDFSVVLQTADGAELRIETEFSVTSPENSGVHTVAPSRLGDSASAVVDLLHRTVELVTTDEEGGLTLPCHMAVASSASRANSSRPGAWWAPPASDGSVPREGMSLTGRRCHRNELAGRQQHGTS